MPARTAGKLTRDKCPDAAGFPGHIHTCRCNQGDRGKGFSGDRRLSHTCPLGARSSPLLTERSPSSSWKASSPKSPSSAAAAHWNKTSASPCDAYTGLEIERHFLGTSMTQPCAYMQLPVRLLSAWVESAFAAQQAGSSPSHASTAFAHDAARSAAYQVLSPGAWTGAAALHWQPAWPG